MCACGGGAGGGVPSRMRVVGDLARVMIFFSICEIVSSVAPGSICVCVCERKREWVYACVCARARVCVSVCVCV